MARRTKRLTTDELERNARRLTEVNMWLKEVDFENVWQLFENDDIKTINGYLFGIFLKLREKDYCICATSLESIREVEHEQLGMWKETDDDIGQNAPE